MATWNEVLEEARQGVGFSGPVVPRNLNGIRAALRADRLATLDGELGILSEGAAFDAFLDHWWTQALADSVAEPEEKERAIEFADLAIALRVRAVRAAGGSGYTQAEVEEMLKGVAS